METKNLAYSQIYFIGRDFEKMHENNQFINFDSIGQRTRAWLHHVIYHFVNRENDYDKVVSTLSNFKKYLKRNKKKYSKTFLKSNLNTIIVLDKLIKNDFNPQEIILENYKPIFYRTFIGEQVEKAKRK